MLGGVVRVRWWGVVRVRGCGGVRLGNSGRSGWVQALFTVAHGRVRCEKSSSLWLIPAAKTISSTVSGNLN